MNKPVKPYRYTGFWMHENWRGELEEITPDRVEGGLSTLIRDAIKEYAESRGITLTGDIAPVGEYSREEKKS